MWKGKTCLTIILLLLNSISAHIIKMTWAICSYHKLSDIWFMQATWWSCMRLGLRMNTIVFYWILWCPNILDAWYMKGKKEGSTYACQCLEDNTVVLKAYFCVSFSFTFLCCGFFCFFRIVNLVNRVVRNRFIH
jgi:hypothetical protein